MSNNVTSAEINDPGQSRLVNSPEICVPRCPGGRALSSIPFGRPAFQRLFSHSHLQDRRTTLLRVAPRLRAGLCQPFNAHRGGRRAAV